MIRRILLALLFAMPVLAMAQDDAKYLKGAVPEVDGKVTFQTSIAIDGKSKAEVYSSVLSWAENLAKERKSTIDDHTKVTYVNPDNGEIVVNAEEYLTFTQSTFSVDRTRIYYTLHILCHDGSYDVVMTRIRYWYEENRNGGVRYLAEDLINDANCLNKAGTKLVKTTAKFRKGTVDLKDELFQEASTAFGVTTTSAARIVSKSEPATAAVQKEDAALAKKEAKKAKKEKKAAAKESSSSDAGLVKGPSVPIVAPSATLKRSEKPVEKVEEEVSQTHILPEETKRETVSFTLDDENPANEMLSGSSSLTITVISPEKGAMMLDFKLLSKERNSKMGTTTYTGEVKKANVK